MIKWFKRNQDPVPTSDEPSDAQSTIDGMNLPIEEDHDSVSKSVTTKRSLFSRLKQSLSKTRHQFGDGIGRLLLGKKEIDATLLDELEVLLLTADLGIETTKSILEQLSDGLSRKQLIDGEAVYNALKARLESILSSRAAPLTISSVNHSPFVILMVGVNGAGKTTTIGKLAKQYQQLGKKVMLAAGDTFRAAAVEQLQVWGQRNGIPVIAQHTGADSASVIFDAVKAAQTRGVDILIADTAGRLHTQSNLMDELKKVKRVMQKIDVNIPHETMLVLDASIGQNALTQARQFHEAIGVTGITMTKLDGTAKGGILFAISNALGIPFRYVGIGEGIDDLRVFDAAQFVGAIFNDDNVQSSK